MTAPKDRKVIHCRCSSVLAKDCWQFKDMGGCLCACHKPDVRGELLAACQRIIDADDICSRLGGKTTSSRVADYILVARALKQMLTRE